MHRRFGRLAAAPQLGLERDEKSDQIAHCGPGGRNMFSRGLYRALIRTRLNALSSFIAPFPTLLPSKPSSFMQSREITTVMSSVESKQTFKRDGKFYTVLDLVSQSQGRGGATLKTKLEDLSTGKVRKLILVAPFG